jgi:hypothetical protein
MTFRNFDFDGEDLIIPLFEKDQWKCDRLVDALEQFVRYGESLGDLAAGKVGAVAVFLTPARYLLKGVPDSAALLRVDYGLRLVEIIEVIDDYIDARDWARVRKVSADAII